MRAPLIPAWLLRIALAVLAVAALVAARSGGAREPRPWAQVVDGMEKVRPGVAPRSPKRLIELSAARGECEAAQIVVVQPMRQVRVEATALVRGETSLQPALYREAWLEVTHASNAEGSTGPWPDALIPARDAWKGEARNAFPADATERRPLVVYFEVCVPASAAAGAYQGKVRLRAEGREPVELEARLQVRSFQLPATATLPTSFGFSALTACVGHGLDRAGPAVGSLNRLYALAALRHRISLHGMTMEPPPPRDEGGVDFSAWDEEVGPLLDGTAAADGARFTSIDIRIHPKAEESDTQLVEYFREWGRHLRERGWLDRAFLYSMDEPKPEDLPEVRRLATLAHRADRQLRVLVTTSLDPLIDGAIDVLTPNLNCLFRRPGDEYCKEPTPLAGYRKARAGGAALWWYQSCGSHGCGPMPPFPRSLSEYFRGWPSYMVDHDGALNRAMGVLAYRHGIDGELYFNTVQAWTDDGGKPSDAWSSVWRFHGNGDGTLFYPGTPARIGGRSHVPVESLRLKLVREGLEDFEYLKLAERLGLRKQAQRAAERLAPLPWRIERSPTVWAKEKRALSDAIEAASARRVEYAPGTDVKAAKGR